jgi:hypothetical protein
MNVHAPQPTVGRVFSVIWFPFFFVAVMCWLFSVTFSAPQAHAVRVAVVAGQAPHGALAVVTPSGAGTYRSVMLGSPGTARAEVRRGAAAAAISCPPDLAPSCELTIASASGRARALSVSADLRAGLEATGRTVAVVDVAPSAPGDRSGAGLFFFALPLAMSGMVTSIMLLQLAMWPTGRKVAVILAVAVFASLVDYTIAVVRHVLPREPVLIVWGFVLVVAIGLTTTAAATWLRQFFVPVVLSFVLLLGVPTSGATVSADMLPAPLALLHRALPLGAFVDITRASAYGIGSAARPAAVLICWAVTGVLLMALAHRHGRAQALARPPVSTEPATHRTHTLSGVVTSLSGAPIPWATITVLDGSGREVERGMTDPHGDYLVAGISTGLHHVVVTAEHCEPVVVTLRLPATRTGTRHDVRLEDWSDPAGNLSAQELG